MRRFSLDRREPLCFGSPFTTASCELRVCTCRGGCDSRTSDTLSRHSGDDCGVQRSAGRNAAELPLV